MKKHLYKFIFVVMLLFITGFVRECHFVLKVYFAANYGTVHINDVSIGNGYYAVSDNGWIYFRIERIFDYSLLYIVPGEPALLGVSWCGGYNCIAVGEKGTIIYAGDEFHGGVEPKSQIQDVEVTFNKVVTFKSGYGDNFPVVFVVGDQGTIFKSTSRIETNLLNWEQLDFPTTDNLLDIAVNEDTIFVTGENYCFYKSTDEGENWIPVSPGSYSGSNRTEQVGGYNRIYFYDENVGYVGGPHGLILKTTDGGTTWGTEVASGFDQINDLYFISPDTGVAVGTNGVARFTTDGGENWFEDDSVTSLLNGETIKKFVLFGDNYGFAIGENDWNMLIAPDSTYLDSIGTITDVKEKYTVVENFKLYQNYPNPFNPTTTIRYSITKTGLVTLKVYNLIGEEITTLVNEEKTAGNYKVEFDASKLPSGVYLYQIKAGSFSQTKKMLLIK